VSREVERERLRAAKRLERETGVRRRDARRFIRGKSVLFLRRFLEAHPIERDVDVDVDVDARDLVQEMRRAFRFRFGFRFGGMGKARRRRDDFVRRRRRRRRERGDEIGEGIGDGPFAVRRLFALRFLLRKRILFFRETSLPVSLRGVGVGPVVGAWELFSGSVFLVARRGSAAIAFVVASLWFRFRLPVVGTRKEMGATSGFATARTASRVRFASETERLLRPFVFARGEKRVGHALHRPDVERLELPKHAGFRVPQTLGFARRGFFLRRVHQRVFALVDPERNQARRALELGLGQPGGVAFATGLGEIPHRRQHV
jgi:hypothetical protein